MLMRPDDCPIDVVDRPVHFALRLRDGLDVGQQTIPDPRLAPAVEAGGHRLPGTVALGQVTPRGARTQDP